MRSPPAYPGHRSALRAVLLSPAAALLARVLLTSPFWINGLSKAVDFSSGAAEMEHLGFAPGALYSALTIALHLGGAALIIARRRTALAAFALAMFTALTIPLVHRFWAFDGLRHLIALYTAEEHVGMIGGLILVAVLDAREHRRLR
ncbi:DoxX family protein [Burkholderia alba]|uniref:DoxX family protein n=1 Tax=Burkholderia alba TaxID=2683677 RepID=UPI002B05EF9A|nr:DoxX family protein [Burkholderia alba]